jgi:hypothetical protein
MLDERGKKVWEVLICDEQRNFEFSQYLPNNKVTSAEVGSFVRGLQIRAGLWGQWSCFDLLMTAQA